MALSILLLFQKHHLLFVSVVVLSFKTLPNLTQFNQTPILPLVTQPIWLGLYVECETILHTVLRKVFLDDD